MNHDNANILAHMSPEMFALIVEGCIHPVGSRVSCNPPPSEDSNSDFDYLILVKSFDDFLQAAENADWRYSNPETVQKYCGPNDRPEESVFFSLKMCSKCDHHLNIIFTTDQQFLSRFLRATRLATKLNLLDKEDRIELFQEILYGDQP